MGGAPQQHVAVAFYGFAASADVLSALYRDAVQWVGATGARPQRLGVGGKGFARELQDFSRLASRLQKNGFDGISSLDLVAARSGRACSAYEFDLNIAFSTSRAGFLLISADSTIVSMDQLLTFARSLVKHLKPEYGIGYRRPLALGPTLYGIGVNYGGPLVFSGPVYEEKVRNTAWAVSGMRDRAYSYGLIRDVYPFNFLTQRHLARTIAVFNLENGLFVGRMLVGLPASSRSFGSGR